MGKLGNFLSFKKSRNFVRKLKLKDIAEWNDFSKTRRPSFLPSHPEITYRNEGWIDWGDWLDNKRIIWPFKNARKFVRKFKFKKYEEWERYRTSREFPSFLPKNPFKYYGDEWISYYDWIGTIKPAFKVNDNYFKTWSHNMAYILGFWFTDGCIIKGRIFNITQHKKDKHLLNQIVKEMGSNYSLYQDVGNTVRIQFTSREIVKDIIRLGGKERKSNSIHFPCVPKKYLADYIRGLWDGDGSVSRKSNKTHSIISSFTTGSRRFIYSLHKVLKSYIPNIKGTIAKYEVPCKKSKNVSTYYVLTLGINDTKRLRDFMYFRPNGLKMIRKYKRFKRAGKLV